jgi:hypothetical protein
VQGLRAFILNFRDALKVPPLPRQQAFAALSGGRRPSLPKPDRMAGFARFMAPALQECLTSKKIAP